MEAQDDGTLAEFWWYPLRWGDTLSNHDWYPFYLNRFLHSDLVAYACAEGRRGDIGTALMLWSESFREDPAGTLPDDDVSLAQMARFGADVASWQRVREGALHGWQRVEIDGEPRSRRPRLGHPMIASIAKDMHKRKVGRDQAREAGRKANLRHKVKKKLGDLRQPKHIRENGQVIEAVTEFLSSTGLYCTDDNVRVALTEAVGVPNVVHPFRGGRDGDERQAEV